MKTPNLSTSSIQRVLAPVFGRRWPLILLLIPIVVTWPLLAFWPLITFEPSDFVEEWIKLSLTTFIFYFIIEIVQERRRTELSRQDLESFRELHLVAPLRQAVDQLETVIAKLTPGEWVDVSDELLVVCRHVEHVRSAFATAQTLVTELRHHSLLAGTNPSQVDTHLRALTDLAKTRHWGVAPIEDLQTTTRGLKVLAASFGQ